MTLFEIRLPAWGLGKKKTRIGKKNRYVQGEIVVPPFAPDDPSGQFDAAKWHGLEDDVVIGFRGKNFLDAYHAMQHAQVVYFTVFNHQVYAMQSDNLELALPGGGCCGGKGISIFVSEMLWGKNGICVAFDMGEKFSSTIILFQNQILLFIISVS